MHWLDITLLVILGISLLRGYRSGFIFQAIQLGSIILAWLLAAPISKVLVDLLSNKGVTVTVGWITWLISFVIVVYLSRLLLRFFLKGVDAVLGGLNKFAGALLSLAVTTMMSVILLNFYSSLSPRYGWPAVLQESSIATELQKMGETILPTRLLIQRGVEEHLSPQGESTPTDTTQYAI
ncbi:MAG: CvpA family protein [Porphyromonas sp.]|nr:CvpA family protein [Porphyromonas sp.]